MIISNGLNTLIEMSKPTKRIFNETQTNDLVQLVLSEFWPSEFVWSEDALAFQYRYTSIGETSRWTTVLKGPTIISWQVEKFERQQIHFSGVTSFHFEDNESLLSRLFRRKWKAPMKVVSVDKTILHIPHLVFESVQTNRDLDTYCLDYEYETLIQPYVNMLLSLKPPVLV